MTVPSPTPYHSRHKSSASLHLHESTSQPATSQANPSKETTGPTTGPGTKSDLYTSSPAPATKPTSSPTPQPAPTSTPPVHPPVPSSTSSSLAPTFSGVSGSKSSADIDAYLSAHNSVRAQHGAAPLTWSDELSAKAQQWADGCVFKHSGGSLGPFGENLAAGTGSGYTIASAVNSWTDEVSQYDPNNPVPSHFTQVVWKATTQVGCAVQDCSGIFDPSFGLAHYHVCEYSPQGNVIGEFACVIYTPFSLFFLLTQSPVAHSQNVSA
ncbi:CAP domain-containing protein [Multifurca ochricompacta]|uniref:CAP domain-containing protein n=1 Tax=Multifurca ochricompacta TaxID=376703 RepID=A0AAD4MCI9_9AGAM|nr:CAP domain-containing protein [Multifurca ochricompacta]